VVPAAGAAGHRRAEAVDATVPGAGLGLRGLRPQNCGFEGGPLLAPSRRGSIRPRRADDRGRRRWAGTTWRPWLLKTFPLQLEGFPLDATAPWRSGSASAIQIVAILPA